MLMSMIKRSKADKAIEEGTQKVAKPIWGQLGILGNVAEELTSPQGQGPGIFRIRFKPNGNHSVDRF